MPIEDERRTARINAIRRRDADRLEASLGRLPDPVKRSRLVVLTGLPGSGKSHFARALAKRYPAAILDSDALREVLFENPQHTAKEHGRLFPAMHVLMDRLLERGIAVIVDATNLKDENRRPYYEIADRRGAEVLLVRIWAPARTIRARLSHRTASPDPADRSSANMDVYEAMLKETERIRRPHVSVDTSGDLGPALDKVLGLLQS